MRRRTLVLFLSILLILALAASSSAAGFRVKLATISPDGSAWDKLLEDMGAQWRNDSQGRVSLQIYPGAVAGDEPDLLRKLRIGQLHAAAMTLGGLGDIDPAFFSFSIPFFFESREELFHVLHKLEPVLRERLEAKGFVLLNWGYIGWVHFFSTEPIESIEDLRRLKIFVWAGDDAAVQRWKRNGFRPVALAVTDVLTGLQTGMIEVYPSPPYAAMSLQWFRHTPYMLDVGLTPLAGANIMTQQAWDRISEQDRPRLLEAARRVEDQVMAAIPRQDEEAVEQMQKRGLTVTHLKVLEGGEDWRQTADKFLAEIRGTRVPPDFLDMVVRERDAYRRAQTAGDSP